MRVVLKQLLDAGWQYEPYYLPSYNSDHLPMTLSAMADLGASDEVLIGFHARYCQRLHPAELGPELLHLQDGRGRREAFVGMRSLLLESIADKGAATVVREYLPVLLPSLATEAFHPLIRLGFALNNQHEMEVASALAYWMTSSFMPQLIEPVLATRLTEVLAADALVGIASGSFGQRLSGLVERDIYPAPVATTLADCASASLDVYLGTRNFFALHLVTATEAARACGDYVSETELVASLSAALRAGYLVLDAPDFADRLPVPARLDEEHALKYVYACASEYEAWGDARYLLEIAEFKAAGLVPEWVDATF
ncbi:MAG: hypothetical protein ACJAYE_001525 [Candidatus Azotimanducaceae bacterium]|jgi:hypothetical protein